MIIRYSIPMDFAVIGAGLIGREHARRLRENPRCQLAAVVDPSPAAAEHGAAHYPDIESMLARHRPDGAIVATPNELHVPHAIALLRAGVPVLVEKPLADSLAAGRELVHVSRETGVAVLVGHHRRHSITMQTARRHVMEGKLGRLAAVNATTLLYKPAAYFETAWRRGPAGGPILINLIHDIDTLRFLAGEIAAVQAVASNRVRQLAVEDTAAVLVEFVSGAVGTLVVSDTVVAPRSWEQTSGENPAFARDASQDCLFLAGTQGSLSVPALHTWRQDGPGSWTEPFTTGTLECQPADPLVRQIDHFCDVIERRAEPLIGAEDGLRTLAAALAVRQAAAARKRIEIDHFLAAAF